MTIFIDPVSPTCAVVDRVRTLGVMLTLNKIGLEMPIAFARIWENKLKSSKQSAIQLENIQSLDPSDRDIARDHA